MRSKITAPTVMRKKSKYNGKADRKLTDFRGNTYKTKKTPINARATSVLRSLSPASVLGCTSSHMVISRSLTQVVVGVNVRLIVGIELVHSGTWNLCKAYYNLGSSPRVSRAEAIPPPPYPSPSSAGSFCGEALTTT